MGYYNIRILTVSQDMTEIVTECDKFRYNRPPMGMCASVYIFQEKLDELLNDIKGVITYIDDILISSKDIFSNEIYQVIFIFSRLRAAGLKLNAHKFSFVLKYIP